MTVELLVTYDVDTGGAAGRARLRRVARICEAYGQRVQKSVFEVVISKAQSVTLRAELETVLTDQDSLIIYQFPNGTLANTISLRRSQHFTEGQPWVL